MRPLLSVALAVLVAAAASARPTFVDVTEQVGLSGGREAAWADYDGDGWADVFIGGTLFHNVEGERFEQVTEGLPPIPPSRGTWGDCDLDGDFDLFYYGGSFGLLINEGDGTFTDGIGGLPRIPVVQSLGASWVDINVDGWPDLYVGGYEEWEKAVYVDAILINMGGNRFRLAWESSEKGKRSARGVTAADFDGDGDSDIYVSNYRLQPNHLWLVTGEIPPREVALERGAAGNPKSEIDYTGGIRYAVSGHTIGSAWGDLDDDGHIDLFVGNFSHPPDYQDRPQFLRNEGPPDWTFEDMSEGAGLQWQESFASPALADYDNDGDLDLYFSTVYGGDHSVLYRNDGDWRFSDVTEEAGISAEKTYQAAWADFDRDGDLDLLTGGRLYRNDTQGGHWLRVRPTPMWSVGTVARIRLGDRVITRQICASTGQGNQNEPVMQFGLGEHDGRVEVQITWPRGMTQTVSAQADTEIFVQP